jgi:uncharacterized protein (TIGR02246 family)
MRASRSLRFAPLLALALLAPLGASAGDSPLAGKSKLWEDAVAKGDANAVAAMYAEDGELMPPNMPRQKGRKAIADLMGGMIAQGMRIKLTDVDTAFCDDLGYKSGDYSVLDKDGKEVDRGKWVEVWRKVKDEWLLTHDIWNSDLPVPAPAPAAESAPKPDADK